MKKRFVSEINENQQRRFLNTNIGIEVEVENTPEHGLPKAVGWTVKRDDSLRNNGREFVTNPGSKVKDVPVLLAALAKVFEACRRGFDNNTLFDFNERTSIHVHVDATNLGLEEIKNVLIVYTLFEESLFEIAGEHRKHNIFCVPLRYLALSEIGGDTMERMILGWKKYCAINFTRSIDLGTVEFRHMEGHEDWGRVLKWVCLLAKMVDFCRTTSNKCLEEEVRKLKYISHYHQFSERVFGPFSEFIEIIPQVFDQAVSDSKMFFNVRV